MSVAQVIFAIISVLTLLVHINVRAMTVILYLVIKEHVLV